MDCRSIEQIKKYIIKLKQYLENARKTSQEMDERLSPKISRESERCEEKCVSQWRTHLNSCENCRRIDMHSSSYRDMDSSFVYDECEEYLCEHHKLKRPFLEDLRSYSSDVNDIIRRIRIEELFLEMKVAEVEGRLEEFLDDDD
jgi:hypothetical protein